MGRDEPVRESVMRAARRGRSEQIAQLSMPVARQIVLQLARRDIGQLTDIETDVYRAPICLGKRQFRRLALDRDGASSQTLVIDERRSR
jgi:hypothetical protein